MPYLGNTPTNQSFVPGTDYFNGTGSQTAFTLSRPVVSTNDIEVVVNNVQQAPNSGYIVSGNTLTFDQAPSAGSNNVYVRYLATNTLVVTPSQGSISYSSLNADMQQDIGISFKNRIINGDMRIDQRNNGAAVTNFSGSAKYTVDRWAGWANGTGAFTAQQSSIAPSGYTRSLSVTVTTADSSLDSTDYYLLSQPIEGNNIADLGWGTANAQSVTLSFWVRSSVTGTFGGCARNSSAVYNYPFQFSINAANTWEYKTVTIPGATAGTWLTDSQVGIYLWISLGTGSLYSDVAGTWSTKQFVTSANSSVNLMATNGATFYLTGVQLEKGTTATAFDTRSYGTELHLCKRYYQLIYGLVGTGFANTSIFSNPEFPVEMRAAPSLGVTGTINFTYAGVSDHNQSPATVTQVGDIGRQNAFVRFNNYSGITSGIPYIRNTNTHALTLSAEL